MQTLQDIADLINESGKARQTTVRQLLAAIGQRRRGRKVLNLLRIQLRKFRLKTTPDFWGVPLDTRVTVLLGPRLGRRPNKPWMVAAGVPPKSNTQGMAQLGVAISESVHSAFAPLLLAMQTEVDRLNETGAEAFKRADYVAAKASANKAEEVASLLAQTTRLERDWNRLAQPSRLSRPASKDKRRRRNFGKLKKGSRTVETEFYRPILETLAEMGGRGKVAKVLEGVRAKMAAILKPADYEPLPAATKSKTIRWWNSAQWARFNLSKQGYLKSDSPHGIWEITEKGRTYLDKLKLKPTDD